MKYFQMKSFTCFFIWIVLLQFCDVECEFNWSHCEDKDYPLMFSDIDIIPIPLHIPGSFKIGFNSTLKKDLQGPLKMEVRICREVSSICIPIPCFQKVYGSCDFEDICAMMPTECPKEFIAANISCHCPFKKGLYDVPPTNTSISVPVPPSLYGNFMLKARLLDQAETELSCLEMRFPVAA